MIERAGVGRRRTTGIWVAITAAAAGCGADLGPQGAADVRVVHYDTSLDLSTRVARSALRVQVNTEGHCVRLPMRSGELRTVAFDDEPMTSGELVDGTMTACGRGWAVGDEFVLSAEHRIPLETWGESQVGFSVTTDSEGAPFHYMVSWVGGCDRFGPCDTAPDRFARYSFHVTHPAEVTVLCPGEMSTTGDETHCEFSMAGGPSYSTFGVVASPSWLTHDLGEWAGANVTLYDMPSTGIAARIDAAQHARFMAWMTDQFGPYPYGDSLRLVVGPTYWNGFEHPGNITLSDQLGTGGGVFQDPLAHTINHELAHQWAGDETTLESTDDFVWKEAMAEYLTFVFEDEFVSSATARSTVETWKRAAAFAEHYPVPQDAPPLLDYYSDAYGPGPMILFRQLEAVASRHQVLSAIAMLLGEERAIGIEDVQRALESATGLPLQGYFDTWVSGDGKPLWPRYSVQLADTEGGIAVTVSQLSPEAGLFGGAFAVRLRGETSDQFADVTFNLGPDGAAQATRTIDPGFEVAGHSFDPLRQTLAGEVGRAAAPEPRFHPWVIPRTAAPAAAPVGGAASR